MYVSEDGIQALASVFFTHYFLHACVSSNIYMPLLQMALTDTDPAIDAHLDASGTDNSILRSKDSAVPIKFIAIVFFTIAYFYG